MLTKLKIFFLVFIFSNFFFTSNSFAYLDPGTGSIILQAILAFIAAAFATISFYWTKFKSILKKIFKRESEKKK